MEYKFASNNEDPFNAFIDMVEERNGCKIFTWKILERNEDGLLSIIIFEDKRVLYGYVKADVDTFKGHIGLRLQANFI